MLEIRHVTVLDPRLALHRRIAAHHSRLLSPVVVGETVDRVGEREMEAQARRFIDDEIAHVWERASAAPSAADDFIAWFTDLKATGPGQGDPLFLWLAEQANLDQFLWFLTQELAGEAGFDDLVALTQVKMPARPKMEMARNLWDEFGRGHPTAAHGAMLSRMADDLGLTAPTDEAVWQALALANLMAGLALDRRHAFRSVGALGVVELTAPGRVALVDAGLRRLGVPPATRRYYEVHASLDIQHSIAWNREVLYPLVQGDPRIATLLAEGALMRLEAGKRCFEVYRTHFGLPAGE